MGVNGSARTAPPAAPGQPHASAPGRAGRGVRGAASGASPAGPGLAGPDLPPAPAGAGRTRRRRGVLAAGTALVAVGALGAAYLTRVVGNTSGVLVVTADVAPGEVLQRSDLAVAQLGPDPLLSPVPAGRLSQVVGRRAAVALPAGSLLTDAAVTDQVLPVAGQTLVGIALEAGQRPAEPLVPGDRVRIVDTPGPQDQAPAGAPQTLDGVVVSTTAADETGRAIVDVTVPEQRAAELAARVATGRVALVLDSRQR